MTKQDPKKFAEVLMDISNFLVRQMRIIDPSNTHLLMLIDNQLYLVRGDDTGDKKRLIARLSAQDLTEGMKSEKWNLIANEILKLKTYPKF